MTKEAVEIVMLPTEDKTNIHIYENGSYMHTNSKVKSTNSKNGYQGQHIYITVSQDVEPIKEGDWCYDEYNKLLFKSGSNNPGASRKIIATTDKSLLHEVAHVKSDISNWEESIKGVLPQLQQSFLKGFVVNPNGEYEVEYEKNVCICIEHEESNGCYHCDGTGIDFYKLKLNQDNTVNITSREEKMYSSVDLIGNQNGSFDHFLLNSSKFSQEEREIAMDAIHDWIKDHDWIKENL
jgi:hypothetical protein